MTTKTVKKSPAVIPIVDSPEEHRISLPGLDIAINHTLKLVFIVDQTGGVNNDALESLETDLFIKGYHLHCVVVAPPTQAERTE